MGNNLAKIRGKYQLTQEELAKKVGVTKQGLCFNENGKLSVKLASAVAATLNENVFDVLGKDVFVLLPQTKEDKEALKRIVDEILGE